MRYHVLTASIALLALSGCTGTVVLTPYSTDAIKADYAKGTSQDGIIVYRPMPVVEVDVFTQISTPNKTPGASPTVSSDCTAAYTRKVVSIADLDHPYLLHYDHGVLETYTFGATLTADGILTAINTQSTPDQGKTFQNVASAVTSLAGPFKIALAGPALPDCTSTPTFAGYEYVPAGGAIEQFGKTVYKK